MAFVTYTEAHKYGMIFTDGYVSDPNSARLAEHIYRLSKAGRYPELFGRANPRYEDPVHVWILGDSLWTENPSAALESLLRHETQEDYRIVIAGLGIGDPGRPPLLSFSSWLRQAGMYRKRKHNRFSEFKTLASDLLKNMGRFYSDHGAPATPIIDSLEIPYVYRGD